MKLRTRLIGGTLLLILLLGVAVIGALRFLIAARLETELHHRGISIAKLLADDSVNPILTENLVALQLVVTKGKKVERDIAYVFVQEPSGAVMVHTFGETFPVGLRLAHGTALPRREQVRRLRTEEGEIYDVAVPIARGELGTVRVGVHGSAVRQTVARVISTGIGITILCLIIFGGLALAADVLITRNLTVLSEATQALGIGDLEHRVPIAADDEFGRLGRAFNAMADNLERSEGKLVELNTVLLREVVVRKRAEEELRRASAELERQNVELKKLERLREGFVRDVSHELKTPVAKHAMQVEILKGLAAAKGFAPEVRKVIEVMESSVRRQQKVIRNLLGLSRLESGVRGYRREPVALDGVLRTVIDDYAGEAAAKEIVFEVALEPITVTSDGEMLWHVFSNLVNNAIKFQPSGSGGRVTVTLTAAGAQAVVGVRDTGIGMDREELSKVFDKFYQATASTEGSGVGLTICKMIIDGVGGRIWFESGGRDAGATAWIALPLGAQEARG